MIKNYDALEIEKEILEFWENNKVYAKVKAKNKGKKPFYFLDGPPYTSGKIHLGIAWNKSLKDFVLRYKRMNGFDVWDRAGYDMHGLPTAHKVMEKLGIKNKDEIPKLGVSKFIEECKRLSTSNMELMNRDFSRLGIWMDFDNPYQSIKNEFMEGEWWLVKKAHDNKRLYEGEKVMHWCPRCGPSLAKHELEYKNVTDQSIFLKFNIKGRKDEYLIIWTTTPWTIAYNLGVMVNPDEDYVRAKVDGEVWVVAQKLANIFISSLDKKFTVLEKFKGQKLEGMEYDHPFMDDLKGLYEGLKAKSKNVHTVLLSAEYVDTSSGSGLVHCAPGCGPEDYEVGHRYGILPFNTLDENGNYDQTMGRFSGLNAKADNERFIQELDKKGALLAKRPVEHEYAHCWRCKNAVVFRTTKQWFFRVEDLKEKMRELNKKVFWVPGWAGSNWFDSWLDNLRDNGITRQRYWGTPLPIWRCDKCNDYRVIGSIAELKKLANDLPNDLHRPYIDKVRIKCSCGGDMKRIPDILDVWVDSGTASWNCLDYPNKDALFRKLWPPHFILEGKDQIRGWFNLLLVASMISMNRHSYKACYMHGFVQDADGRKMSKSLGNIISPYEVIDKFGSDTLRYYLVGGANPGLDIIYNSDDIKIKQKNLTVLWNLHKYLIDMVNNSKVDVKKLKIDKKRCSIEEKYILSKLNSTIKKVTELAEQYKLNEIPWLIEELYLELSRTYIQLTREKSSLGTDKEKELVIAVTYYVLFEVMKLSAPIMPFITEKISLNLKDVFGLKGESIHLHRWPQYIESDIDSSLENNISVIQNVVQSVLAGRERIGLGIRWPLSEIIVVSKDKKAIEAVEKLESLLKIQTNVKEVRVQQTLPGIKLSVKADFGKLGPDFGKLAPKIVARLAVESPKSILSHIEKEGKFAVDVDGAKVNLVREHIIVERTVPDPYQEADFKGGFLYLNKELDKELEQEGFAREIMRRVQSLRKKAGLEKKDRVDVFIRTELDLSRFEEQIINKVGARTLTISESSPKVKFSSSSKEKVKGRSFEIFLGKVE
ncbi:isoleucine--tRNA ligase [Candidatus Woesearchaeota archaeon]|nr:isoleucine--tRNA ligase [Candidatus Woesearchaeota archaeon]